MGEPARLAGGVSQQQGSERGEVGERMTDSELGVAMDALDVRTHSDEGRAR